MRKEFADYGSYESMVGELSLIREEYEKDPENGLFELAQLGIKCAQKAGEGDIFQRHDHYSEIKNLYKVRSLEEVVMIALSYCYFNCDYDEGLRSFDEILDLVAIMITRRSGEVSLECHFLLERMMESFRKGLFGLKIINYTTFSTYPMRRLLSAYPSLKPATVPVIMDMARSDIYIDKDGAFSILGDQFTSEETLYFMAEYFGEPGYADTLYADDALDWVLRIVMDEAPRSLSQMSDETKQAFRACMTAVENVMPLATEREHDGYILGKLKYMVEIYPVVKRLMGDGLKKKVSEYKEKDREGVRGYITKDGWNGYTDYSFLVDLLPRLPREQKRKLRKMISEEKIDWGEGGKRWAILKDVFSAHGTDDFANSNYLSGEDLSEVVECLSKNEFVLELMGLIVGREEFNFQMGILLSMLDFSDFPDELKERIDPVQVKTKQNLKLKNGSWNLCSESEPRLIDAIVNDALLMVDDYLLVKFKGKMAALCMETFINDNGFTFVKGCWYSIKGEARKVLKRAYKEGEVMIALDGPSEWVLMRDLNNAGSRVSDEIMYEAQKKVSEMMRSDYVRNKKSEVYREALVIEEH